MFLMLPVPFEILHVLRCVGQCACWHFCEQYIASWHFEHPINLPAVVSQFAHLETDMNEKRATCSKFFG